MQTNTAWECCPDNLCEFSDIINTSAVLRFRCSAGQSEDMALGGI